MSDDDAAVRECIENCGTETCAEIRDRLCPGEPRTCEEAVLQVTLTQAVQAEERLTLMDCTRTAAAALDECALAAMAELKDRTKFMLCLSERDRLMMQQGAQAVLELFAEYTSNPFALRPSERRAGEIQTLKNLPDVIAELAAEK